MGAGGLLSAPMTTESDRIPAAVPLAGDALRVGPSERHGLGVFATRDLEPDEVVHVAPVLLMSDEDVETLESTPLRGFVYGWDTDAASGSGSNAAFALGVGSLINHDPDPNCVYHRIDAGDVDELTGAVHTFDALQYSTVRPVAAGEELTVDYSGGDPSILWFDPV